MSKNYELLQQAEFALGAARPFTTAQHAAAAPEEVAPARAEVLASLEPVVREEALKLVQRLFLTPDKAAPKAVLFASIDSSTGCNWLCVIVARLLAQRVPGSVCLVDGNFRTPSLPETLGLSCDHGLIDSLQQGGSIRGFVKPVGSENLAVLPAGANRQDATLLLNSDCMKERFSELRREFDYVVVNAPPLNAFADGIVLGRLVDGVVLVLEANATRREAAVRVAESLKAMKIPILGAVLNNRTFPIPAAVYKRL
jgi:succinoglycan biosynthesis transport protein ExoP